MSGVICRRRDDCIGILELSSRYVPSPDREVENALVDCAVRGITLDAIWLD